MTDTSFIESEERQALRKAVASWVANYGHEYYLDKARKHEHTSELWAEAGKLGFLGVNLPEEYGGGGAGMYELSLVMEEMAAAGSALLLMVVSPAINGTIIAKFGTDDQKKRWLPGIADGRTKCCSSTSLRRPTTTGPPLTCARTPCPATAVNALAAGIANPRSCAAATIAAPMGCSEPDSTAAASRST